METSESAGQQLLCWKACQQNCSPYTRPVCATLESQSETDFVCSNACVRLTLCGTQGTLSILWCIAVLHFNSFDSLDLIAASCKGSLLGNRLLF